MEKQQIADALATAARAVAFNGKLSNIDVEHIDDLAGSLFSAFPVSPSGEQPLPFGEKVSSAFRNRVRWIAEALALPAADLMLCMAWESGRTFSASVRNAAGSGAVGLIQFMPQTAAALGTSTGDLAKMTAEDQLNYVYKYFSPYKGRLHNLGDIYMAILWPAGVGKSDSYVLFNAKTGPTTYAQNKGLDGDKDGVVTRLEAYSRVEALRAEGMRAAA